jgi:hypothetical protein
VWRGERGRLAVFTFYTVQQIKRVHFVVERGTQKSKKGERKWRENIFLVYPNKTYKCILDRKD